MPRGRRFEGIREVLDLSVADDWNSDGDGVEATGSIVPTPALQEPASRPSQVADFLAVDGILWIGKLTRPQGLDLNEDHRLTVEHHQVEFAHRRGKPPNDGLESAAAQVLFSQPLAFSSQLMPRVAHLHPRSTARSAGLKLAFSRNGGTAVSGRCAGHFGFGRRRLLGLGGFDRLLSFAQRPGFGRPRLSGGSSGGG